MTAWIYTHDIHPILFHLGPLKGTWYGLMYALGFLFFYWSATRAARNPASPIQENDIGNLLIYSIIGVILGGRLGYVFFYGGMEYLLEPWRILQTWKGGMSFHGAILGIIGGVWFYARRNKLTFLQVMDFGIPWATPGLFFGRVGNFINGELYGKPTDGTWGVIFPSDPDLLPRHPSQLYEAVLEGLVVFIVLVILRRRVAPRPGLMGAVFLLLYGLSRFAVEFIRLPDQGIGYTWGWVTRGQMLSLPMILIGLGWLILMYKSPAPAATQPRSAQPGSTQPKPKDSPPNKSKKKSKKSRKKR